MFVSATYAGFAITTLVTLAKREPTQSVQDTMAGNPRANIQNKKGKARAYQVRQVLKAIERLRVEHGIEK